MELPTKDVTVLVKVVESAKNDDFPGLYCDRLNPNCFSSDSNHVFVTSPWRSKMELLCINIKNGNVSKITNDPDIGSWHLLDLVDDCALAVCSAPNRKPHLVFSDLTGYLSDQSKPLWAKVEKTDATIPDISWTILDFQPKGCGEEEKFQAILITPDLAPDQKYPLVVIPHGGPHSVIESGYYFNLILFVKLNFAVLAVNYRGSTGFGDKVLRSLLGSIGSADVSDMQQAVNYMLTKDWIDSKRIVLSGGSHGGFLSLHLIGQYPEVYRACVCRNPVSDVSGKLEGTDIPDWGFTESGQQDKFSFSTLPVPDIRKRMWDVSPYQYVSKVQTPLLMLIGQNDQRVPPSQGMCYYRSLKALGKICQMYVYPDNHSLSSAKVESDSVVRAMLWIFQHLDMC